MEETKFEYKGIDYILNSCPEYPFSIALLENNIASSFQDGYVTSRKRISKNFCTYSLTFKAVPEIDKIMMQKLEYIVGTSDLIIWYPNMPLEPMDYNPDGTENIQPRDVRIVNPIQYDLIFYKHYDFTVNLQQGI
jgi:hypothetical protein